MKFYGTKVYGFKNAMVGARLPMCKDYNEALSKSDSIEKWNGTSVEEILGESDLKLAKNLINADNSDGKVGTPNSKFLQMIEVWVTIEAPLTFWKEFDTYRHMVKNSTSTMHKIQSYEICEECFEPNPISNKCSLSKEEIEVLENARKQYNETKDKSIWYDIIYKLPDSWLQTRMCHFNYATLQNMCCWRENHKQNCWSGKDNKDMNNFMSWAKSLPYFNELIYIKKSKIIKQNTYYIITSEIDDCTKYFYCDTSGKYGFSDNFDESIRFEDEDKIKNYENILSTLGFDYKVQKVTVKCYIEGVKNEI